MAYQQLNSRDRATQSGRMRSQRRRKVIEVRSVSGIPSGRSTMT
jgi:hypothetical protein